MNWLIIILLFIPYCTFASQNVVASLHHLQAHWRLVPLVNPVCDPK